MMPNSFNLNSPMYNSMEMWGLKIISHDVFSAPKRSRRKQIPFRHGSYDMGPEKYYDDRTLRLECQLTRPLPKADFREIIYALSQKNALFLWDEPEKFYRGELYDSVDVDVFPKEIGRNFNLPFVCQPFAYGLLASVPLQEGINAIDYEGTAETPTLIIIRNPNPFPISNIAVTAISQVRG